MRFHRPAGSGSFAAFTKNLHLVEAGGRAFGQVKFNAYITGISHVGIFDGRAELIDSSIPNDVIRRSFAAEILQSKPIGVIIGNLDR